MKPFILKDAMHRMLVGICDTGFFIENGAGRANYDKFGKRTTVNGIPEFFPSWLAIENTLVQTVVSVGETELVSDAPCKKVPHNEVITISIQMDDTQALKQLDALKNAIDEAMQGIGLKRAI